MCILGTTREAQQNKLSSLSAHYNGPPRYNNWRYSNHTLWYTTHIYVYLCDAPDCSEEAAHSFPSDKLGNCQQHRFEAYTFKI